jgi:hypothetical protein
MVIQVTGQIPGTDNMCRINIEILKLMTGPLLVVNAIANISLVEQSIPDPDWRIVPSTCGLSAVTFN